MLHLYPPIWDLYNLGSGKTNLHEFEMDLKWICQIEPSWTTTVKRRCLVTGFAWLKAVLMVFGITFVLLLPPRLDTTTPPCMFRTMLKWPNPISETISLRTCPTYATKNWPYTYGERWREGESERKTPILLYWCSCCPFALCLLPLAQLPLPIAYYLSGLMPSTYRHCLLLLHKTHIQICGGVTIKIFRQSHI